MVAILLDFVGADVDHVEVKPVELRYLDVGGEYRNHEGDFVAFVEQVVFLNGIKHVAHAGCAAFGGEEVVDCVVAAAAHFLAQVVLHEEFGVAEDAVGGGVLVADDGFGPSWATASGSAP